MWNSMKATLQKVLFLCSSICLVPATLYSTCYDNRIFPWIPSAPLRTVEQHSFLKTEAFFMTADSAHGTGSKEKKGIPEIYGDFDLRALAQASELVGNTNHLRPLWQSQIDLLWNVLGDIESQGIHFSGEKCFKNLSFGFSGAIMHASSNQKFVLPKDIVRRLALTSADQQEMDQDRRTILQDLGFKTGQWATTTLSDVELFVRYGASADYKLKSRQASGGLTFSLFLPAMQSYDYDYPAAVPFGVDSMKGMAVTGDVALELKEDLWFSCLASLSQRFGTVQTRRIPVKDEPVIFGATKGDVYINPGITWMLSPAITIKKLQGPIGVQVQYLYSGHAGDVWGDRRADKSIAVTLPNIYKKHSAWKSEYLRCSVFCDNTLFEQAKINPVVAFTLNLPLKFIKPENMVRTYRVGLSIDCAF